MDKKSQRYISNELTHFIGKGKRTNSQYDILIKILKEGWLTYPPHTHNIGANLIVSPSAKISKNEMYSPQIVCFCDIPVEDLAIHVNKYSKFGISFYKEFIIKQGGAPVYYLPLKSRVRDFINLSLEDLKEFNKPDGGSHLLKTIDKGDYFDDIVRRYHKLFRFLHKCIYETLKSKEIENFIWDYPKDYDGYHELDLPRYVVDDIKSHSKNSTADPVMDAIWYDRQLGQFEKFLNFHIFSFIKFYDNRLSETHPENYYFEREWRVVGNIKFSMKDVMRVLIPEKYAKQFRRDCPRYFGQMTFI